MLLSVGGVCAIPSPSLQSCLYAYHREEEIGVMFFRRAREERAKLKQTNRTINRRSSPRNLIINSLFFLTKNHKKCYNNK